jgi:hypothetical protein
MVAIFGTLESFLLHVSINSRPAWQLATNMADRRMPLLHNQQHSDSNGTINCMDSCKSVGMPARAGTLLTKIGKPARVGRPTTIAGMPVRKDAGTTETGGAPTTQELAGNRPFIV